MICPLNFCPLNFDLLSVELPADWHIDVPEDEYGLFDARDTNEFRYVIASKEKIGEVSLDELLVSGIKLK